MARAIKKYKNGGKKPTTPEEILAYAQEKRKLEAELLEKYGQVRKIPEGIMRNKKVFAFTDLPPLPQNYKPSDAEIQYAADYYGVPTARAKYNLAYPQFAPGGGQDPSTWAFRVENTEEPFVRTIATTLSFAPVLGEILDIINVPWAAATGTDMYTGQEMSTSEAGAWAAGGIVIPNVLQKPTQWLLKQGAKNSNDIKRIIEPHLKNIDNAPEELKPLLELQEKSFELKSHLRQYDVPQGTDMGGGFKSTLNQVDPTSEAAANFLTQTNPELVLRFSPSSFNKGMFDADLAKWGDAYLTSYRGVRAKNIDEAATFMRNPYGGGLQQYGKGTYSTSNLPTAKGYGSHVGAIRDMPSIGRSGEFGGDIVKDISNLEAFGGSRKRIYGANPDIIKPSTGIETTGDIVRVSRPETTVKSGILDVVPKEQADNLLRYRSDFGGVGLYGAGGYGHPQTKRGMNEIYRLISEGKLNPQTIKEKGGKINSYEKGGILQSMAKKNRSDKNKFVSSKVKVLRKEGKGLKQAVAMALDMWERKKKKYAEGGAVEGFGIQTNFSQDPNALQPTDVEQPDEPQEELEALIPDPPPTYEEETFGASEFNTEHQRLGITENVEQAGMGGYDEAIMASEWDQFANKAIEETPIFGGWAAAGKFVGEAGTNLIVGDSTGQDRKNRQMISAAIFSPHKLLAMREAEKSGDFHYIEEEEETEEVIPNKYTDFWSAEKAEEGFAAKGIKIKKKRYDNGGILEALRQRRAERRIEKTPVRDASSQEALEMLASYGPDSPMMQAEYSPENREIVMYTGDPDARKHEEVHVSQYGPLQRLARKMDSDYSARIQDPAKRRSYRELSADISPEAFKGFNDAGRFIMNEGEEFEAVLTTAVNAAKEMGVDFTGSFDDIKNQLKTVQSPTNNMTGLMKFMDNTFTDKQKDLILQALR